MNCFYSELTRILRTNYHLYRRLQLIVSFSQVDKQKGCLFYKATFFNMNICVAIILLSNEFVGYNLFDLKENNN